MYHDLVAAVAVEAVRLRESQLQWWSNISAEPINHACQAQAASERLYGFLGGRRCAGSLRRLLGPRLGQSSDMLRRAHLVVGAVPGLILKVF